MLKRFIFTALIIIAFGLLYPLSAQDWFKDTVWMRQTDQSQGFWKVKFSNTDSLIVANGLEMDLFFDAKTGKEIKRIPGYDEILFINNDNNFIRINNALNHFEIFDTKSFQVIDTLENDLIKISESPFVDISKDDRYLVTQITSGFRIWDLKTKKIFKTKIFPNEPNLININYSQLKFNCDNSEIIGKLGKTYQDTSYPGDPAHYKSYAYYVAYEFNKLDSIDYFGYGRSIRISNLCKYYAYATGDPDFGVEVYDFNSKQLLWKIPINGPSLTGIEFSTDDKYLVTTNWTGDYGIKIWELETNIIVYSNKDGGFANFNISHDGKLIITSIGHNLLLYPSRFNPTSAPDPNKDNKNIIFPNPTTGIATIQFSQPNSEITNITLNDIYGNIIKPIFNGFLEQGSQSININTSELSIGAYLIRVQNQHISLTFKLIIN